MDYATHCGRDIADYRDYSTTQEHYTRPGLSTHTLPHFKFTTTLQLYRYKLLKLSIQLNWSGVDF